MVKVNVMGMVVATVLVVVRVVTVVVFDNMLDVKVVVVEVPSVPNLAGFCF